MLYRTMPKIDEKLSVLGFGCMRLPATKEGLVDKPRAIEQIRYAVDQGVNYIDTAWPYHSGVSEIVVGEALCSGYRDKAYIATKLPSWMVTGRDHMDYFLNEQLKRLKTGQIDFYLMHNLAGPMWNSLKQMEILDFIEKAKQSGRIKHAGFSFHGRVDDFKRIVDDYPWEFCQIQYNYLDEYHQAGTEGLKYAAENDLGIIIMEPLRGGNLGIPDPPSEIAAVWDRAPEKRTPVEWALRWVWDHPEVTTVLSGMNEEAHVKENIRIARAALPQSLSPEEHALISEASDTYKKLMKVNCTGCQYCMPCPEDVNISSAFEILNKLYLFKNEEEAKIMYAARCSNLFSGSDKEGYASNCIQCGECIEKCPQSIPIPDILEDVVDTLEDKDLYERLKIVRKMLTMD